MITNYDNWINYLFINKNKEIIINKIRIVLTVSIDMFS